MREPDITYKILEAENTTYKIDLGGKSVSESSRSNYQLRGNRKKKNMLIDTSGTSSAQFRLREILQDK